MTNWNHRYICAERNISIFLIGREASQPMLYSYTLSKCKSKIGNSFIALQFIQSNNALFDKLVNSLERRRGAFVIYWNINPLIVQLCKFKGAAHCEIDAKVLQEVGLEMHLHPHSKSFRDGTARVIPAAERLGPAQSLVRASL